MKAVEELADQYRHHPEVPLTDAEQARLMGHLFELDRSDWMQGQPGADAEDFYGKRSSRTTPNN